MSRARPHVALVSDRTRPNATRRSSARLVVTAALALLALVLPACSDDDDGSAGEAARTVTTSVDDAFEALLVEDLSLTVGEARCVRTRVGELFAADEIQLVVQGDATGTTQADFDEVLGACAFEAATPEDPLVRRPGEPFTYGDDPALDLLWDECAASGTEACDTLFNESPEGSEYEAFANTCGGRGVQVACAPGADPATSNGPPPPGAG